MNMKYIAMTFIFEGFDTQETIMGQILALIYG